VLQVSSVSYVATDLDDCDLYREGEMPRFLYLSRKRRDVRECYVYVINLFFGLYWCLTENTTCANYDDQSRRDII
jgi:hypothetical protein